MKAGGDSSKKSAIPAVTLNRRLYLGMATPGGARGSLTRCLVNLKQQTTSKETIHRDFAFQKIELKKSILTIRRLKIELDQVRNKRKVLETRIPNELETVKSLQSHHAQILAQQSCYAEYESLAKLTAHRHPTPTLVLQEKMNEVTSSLEKTRHDLKRANGEVKIRQAQFQLLIQSIQDLRQSLTEPILEEELEEGEEPMEVEEKKLRDDSSRRRPDIENELYDDL